MLESRFNKVADPQACNFIKKRLQHRRFSGKLAKSLRTPFLRLLLSCTGGYTVVIYDIDDKKKNTMCYVT